MSNSNCVVLVVFAVLFALVSGLHNDSTDSWPSLQLSFSIKRAASQIHGQSEFSVFANPIVSLGNPTSVLYDSLTTFEEDEVLYNYLLVDGIAYTSRDFRFGGGHPAVNCLEVNILPPVNLLVAALNHAKAVAVIFTSEGDAIPCSRGNTYEISMNDGIKFGLCYSGSSGFTLFGNDVDIKVEYLKKRLPIQAPRKSCKTVMTPTSVTSISKSFLTGKPILDEDRSLGATIDILMDKSCFCSTTPRPCIFIHGLGVRAEEKKNLDSHSYWGNLRGHAPCCTSIKYAKLNTLNNSWTDPLLQQKVCNRALAVSKTSNGSTISDTIIITHSMGGLIMAGAIANNTCELASSTSWVSIAAPMAGSMAADYFQESCNDQTNVFMEKYVRKKRLCPADEGIKSLVYYKESYSTPELDKKYEAAQKAYRNNVYAAMCSNSFSGLISRRQAGFWALGSVISHKSRKNDGLVEFRSCAGGLPLSKFDNNYRSRFYVSRLNHHDMAFKTGDALLDKSKMPVKWFECLL